MDQQSITDSPTDSLAMPGLSSTVRAVSWQDCDSTTDLSAWNPRIARFFDYWRSIAPTEHLPGRQHFDPLDIVELMPRVWILDVLRDSAGMRFRYRLVGTKEVGTLQRDVTGRWLDEVQPHLREMPNGFARFHYIADEGKATYRKGPTTFLHHKDHRIVENCMVPMARDGAIVDMIMACSVLYQSSGKEN